LGLLLLLLLLLLLGWRQCRCCCRFCSQGARLPAPRHKRRAWLGELLRLLHLLRLLRLLLLLGRAPAPAALLLPAAAAVAAWTAGLPTPRCLAGAVRC
jgi:hypothetical protein